jgi:hypothetical protein
VLSHRRSLFAFPCGTTRASSPTFGARPKTYDAQGPTDPSQGPRDFRRADPLLEPAAHPLSCLHAREKDGCPFRISCLHRADAPRERDAPTTIGLQFRAAPRRVTRAAKAEVRSAAPRSVRSPEDCSPCFRPGGLFPHAAPESPGGAPTLCSRKCLRLFDHLAMPGVTSQAPEAARASGTRDGLRRPLPPRSIAAPAAASETDEPRARRLSPDGFSRLSFSRLRNRKRPRPLAGDGLD